MHEPTTVTLESSEGFIDYFNVGTSVNTNTSTVLTIGTHSLIVGGRIDRSKTGDLMQRFSDLLTDAGV